jgi:hypothetical protein
MTKPKAKPKGTMAARAAATARRHPIVTWSSLGAICGIFATMGPAVWYVAHYYDPVSDAIVRDANLRKDFASAKLDGARIAAWNTVTLMQMQTQVARNRVNDCDIKDDKRDKMTVLERQACAQYREDLRNATVRFDDARRAALAISGGT